MATTNPMVLQQRIQKLTFQRGVLYNQRMELVTGVNMLNAQVIKTPQMRRQLSSLNTKLRNVDMTIRKVTREIESLQNSLCKIQMKEFSRK